jgi:hypothetical protein
MATTVIHIKDAPLGWKNNPEFVYIGRYNAKLHLSGSPFQNPHYLSNEADRNIVWEAFRDDFYKNENLKKLALARLADKTLVCFCKPKRCHGDILAEYVNGKS